MTSQALSFLFLFYFISFALKNTKKTTHTHMYRYANKILGQGHGNS